MLESLLSYYTVGHISLHIDSGVGNVLLHGHGIRVFLSNVIHDIDSCICGGWGGGGVGRRGVGRRGWS